ncbi:hypothetical protein K438DRAFT_2034516, partial [Mycena galopus ATCC 62051]
MPADRIPKRAERDHDAHSTTKICYCPSTFDEDADDGDDELVAPMQRPPGVTLELWGSLLKAHGYAVDDARGGVVLSPARAREMERENENERRGGPVGQWYSTTTATGASSAGLSSLSPAKRLQLDVSTSFVTPIPRPDAVPEPSAPSASIPSTVFAGLRFLLYGETHNSTVRRAIEDAGGVVASHAAQADYIVVRLVSGSALFATEPSASVRTQYRTECWLELCPFVDRVFAPEEHPSFVPFGVELPVPGHLGESPSRPPFHATHLLCPSGTGTKYTKARQWGVLAVDMGWLAAMARTDAVPLVDTFLVALAVDADLAAPAPPPSSPAQRTQMPAGEITRARGRQTIRRSRCRIYASPPRDGGANGATGGGFFLPPPSPRELPPQRLSNDILTNQDRDNIRAFCLKMISNMSRE